MSVFAESHSIAWVSRRAGSRQAEKVCGGVVGCYRGVGCVIVAVGVLARGPCYGHAGDVVYPIYEVPAAYLPALTDGTMADWEEAVPGPSLVPLDFARLSRKPLDLGDLAIRVFLAWHAQSQRIYVGVEVVDDRYVGYDDDGTVPETWRARWGFAQVLLSDSFLFIVDGDHSGGRFAGYDSEVLGQDAYERITGSQAQEYQAILESPDGRRLGYHGAGNGWVPRPPYADIGTYQDGEQPSLAGYEFYVTPWDDLDWVGAESSIASRLGSRQIVGFNIIVRDHDDKPGFDAVDADSYCPASATGPLCGVISANGAVDGELVPCHILDCSAVPGASAVAADSWARIKAAFTGDRRSSR